MMYVLAQGDSGNWIELIIYLVVIGGSMLGGISQWLIRKFSRESSDDTGGPRQEHRPGRSPAPPGRRPESARPVARPMPRASDRARSEPQRPVAKPLPPRPVQRPTATPAEKRPARTHRPVQPVAREPVRRRPAPPPPAAPPPKPPPPKPAPPRSAQVQQRAPKPAKRKAKRRARGPVDVVSEADVERALADRDFEHALPDAGPYGHSQQTSWLGDLAAQPTRKALRQAIVMSEVLGRPLALRQPGDQPV